MSLPSRTARDLFAVLAIALALGAPGCGPREDGDLGFLESRLTAAERRARLTRIRDAAAANGLTNGVLLAGIAQAETGLAHCWSEATWACMGPTSSDCGGGPVIAGAGDGPCDLMQGGLGMFQFDAGTYDQTLAREGDRILTIAGNVQAAIDFTVAMVIRSVYVDGVDTREQALAWMNSVVVGGAGHMAWIQTVTRYYNGCVPGSCSVYDTRFAHYDDALRHVYDEMGADFWAMGEPPACDPVPAAGRVIDDVDPCVFLGGDLRYWRSANDAGYGGSLRWTHTTDDAAAANYAIWRVVVEASGDYELLVHADPAYAQSRMARYVVTTDLGDETVPIDQTAGALQSLGTFALASATEYAVRLDDNTGEPLSGDVQLVADALEVRATSIAPPDAGGGDADGGVGEGDGGASGTRDPVGSGCGCVVAGAPAGAPRAALIAIGLAISIVTRRRRKREARRA